MPSTDERPPTPACAACGAPAGTVSGDDENTRCEWCGAEYPVPERTDGDLGEPDDPAKR
jgi:hypothetical protein